MAYEGQSGQHFINFNALSFTTVKVIIVSGNSINPCGHSILQIDDFYFHIIGLFSYPKFLTKKQFSRYIKENNKTIIFTTRRFTQNKKAAMAMLKSLLAKRWMYALVTYNCLTFVEDIVFAGGDNINMVINCPTLLRAKVLSESSSWHNKEVKK